MFAWLLLGQLPSAVQFLGGAFILAGVALVRLGELRAQQSAADAAQPRPHPPGLAPSQAAGH